MTLYQDDKLYSIASHNCRVLCAQGREALTDIENGPFAGGQRFTLLDGDAARNDSPAGRLPRDIPERCMFAAEGWGSDARGKNLSQSFKFMFPAIPQTHPHLFFVLAQWNAAPEPSRPWAPPPFELGLMPARDNEPPRLVMILNGEAGAPPIIKSYGQTIKAGVAYECALFFRDGRGGVGSGEVWLKEAGGAYTSIIWKGPTGRPGYSVPFPALGLYRHPGLSGQVEMLVKDWRLLAA